MTSLKMSKFLQNRRFFLNVKILRFCVACVNRHCWTFAVFFTWYKAYFFVFTFFNLHSAPFYSVFQYLCGNQRRYSSLQKNIELDFIFFACLLQSSFLMNLA